MGLRRVLRRAARFVLCRVAGPCAAGAVEDLDVAIPSSPDLSEYVILSVSDATDVSVAVAVEESEVFCCEQGSEGELSSVELSCASDSSLVEDLGEEAEMVLSSTPLSSAIPADCTLGSLGVEDSEDAAEMFLTAESESSALHTEEVEVCPVVQTPIPAVPVVRTRSGRVSRRPDRYGDWLYYWNFNKNFFNYVLLRTF